MMENLINDLLDLAKLENNAFTLSSDYFSLSCAIYEAFRIVSHTASKNLISLRATIDDQSSLDLIHSILGDKRRYMQILLNFLSNAIKFTNSYGSVTIAIKLKDHQLVKFEDHASHKKMPVSPEKESKLEEEMPEALQRSNTVSNFAFNSSWDMNFTLKMKNGQSKAKKFKSNKELSEYIEHISSLKQSSKKPDTIVKEGQERFISLEIRVIDTGIGISEQGQKNLFIDFNRLEENQDRNKSGTGLGLSICKKIIE